MPVSHLKLKLFLKLFVWWTGLDWTTGLNKGLCTQCPKKYITKQSSLLAWALSLTKLLSIVQLLSVQYCACAFTTMYFTLYKLVMYIFMMLLIRLHSTATFISSPLLCL